MCDFRCYLRNLPIGRKMVLTMVGMVLTLLAFLSFYLYQDSTAVLRNQAKLIVTSNSEKNVLNHDYAIRDTEDRMFGIISDDDFTEFIIRYATDQALNDNISFDFQTNVMPKVRQILADSQKIAYIEVHLSDCMFQVSQSSFNTDEEGIGKKLPEYQWESIDQVNALKLPFNTFDSNIRKKGYLKAVLNNDIFFQGINEDESSHSGLIVLGQNGRIVHHSSSDDEIEGHLFETAAEHPFVVEDFVIDREKLINGWQVITYSSLKNFHLDLISFIVRVGIAGIIVLLSGGIFGRVFSRWLVQPIRRLNYHISKTEKDSLPETVPVTSEDEVGQLTASYNRMVADLADLFEKKQVEERAKHEAQLSAYQAQIQPHFLYNTLAIISWSAKKGDLKIVTEITNNLAKYYRLVLAKGKRVASLKDELDLVQYYLEIQKIRFPDQLTASIEIDPEIDAEELFIMHRILQPLVENALEHGVFPKGEGRIQVTVCQDSSRIYLYVADNGVGTDRETVEKIKAAAELSNRQSGFSLLSIIQALHSYYGPALEFHFDSIAGEGTMVSIIIDKWVLIPLKTSDD